MNLPSRRRLGAAALIVAGIGAFLVPFLLHSPSSQGTSPTTGGNDNNNNGGQTTKTGGTGDNGGSSGGNGNGGGSGNCTEDKSHDAKSHDPNPHGNAYGVLKNKLDTTVALVKAMGVHTPAFHLHHDTNTDNDNNHGNHGVSHDRDDHDSSCASGEEEHDQD